MAVTLATLEGQLQALVPASGGIPTSAQYTQAVKDAVHAFNERVGRKKVYEFTTAANTAEYSLPDDFSQLLGLEAQAGYLVRSGNVAVTASGLVPLNSYSAEPDYFVAGNTLKIFPTPTGAEPFYAFYRAVHVLDNSDIYPDMTDREASIIMARAQANAWRLVASIASVQDGWLYRLGDLTIDKKNATAATQKWVQQFDDDFLQRVEAYIGFVGGMFSPFGIDEA